MVGDGVVGGGGGGASEERGERDRGSRPGGAGLCGVCVPLHVRARLDVRARLHVCARTGLTVKGSTLARTARVRARVRLAVCGRGLTVKGSTLARTAS